MDTALQLRIAYDSNKHVSGKDADALLRQSKLVGKLTAEFIPHNTYAVWRLLALAEIPYARSLDYTNKVTDFISKNMGTVNGFSLFGNVDDFLPCYNSMLVEAYCKLGYPDHILVKNGVEWILKYQPVNRLSKSGWDKRGVKKYGGCFNDVPCYIGVAKAVKAIQQYLKCAGTYNDTRLIEFVEEATEYILSHRLYMRHRNDEPVFKDILNLSFPYNYKLNIVELLGIVKEADKLKREGCNSAKDYLNSRKMENGYWKVDYNYKAKGYISFDSKKGNGEWVTHIINKLLE